jgi:large conductance mechanosensitive channel
VQQCLSNITFRVVPGKTPTIQQYEPARPASRRREVGIAAEFKEFAMKGNVVDLAVGVIIGAAFGKIVSSLVGDIIMPGLGKVIGGFNFSDLALSLGKDPTGKDVLVKYGSFIQTCFDFAIIAIVLFLAIKGINKLKKPAPSIPAPPPPPPRSEVLLEEIRTGGPSARIKGRRTHSPLRARYVLRFAFTSLGAS